MKCGKNRILKILNRKLCRIILIHVYCIAQAHNFNSDYNVYTVRYYVFVQHTVAVATFDKK